MAPAAAGRVAALARASDRSCGRHAGPLIAELPGVRDAAGQSPFWQGLSAHFYAEYPLQAQRPFGVRWRIDVAALLPRHPVYTSFLPPSAHAAIGQAAPEAQGWMAALVQAGLHHGHTWRCMTADRCWRRISTRSRRCWRRGGGSSCRRRRT